MAISAPNWPIMPNVSHKSSRMDAAASQTEQISKRNRRRKLPRITLPILILAVASELASPASADKNMAAPRVTTPVSLVRTVLAVAPDAARPVMLTTALAMPSTSENGHVELRKRSGDDNDESSSTKGTAAKDKSSSTTTTASTGKAKTTTEASPSPLPSPFDAPPPSAFQLAGGGDSCPKFMSNLLSDPTFKSCYPISMLIQTSTSFFNAEKQLVSLVKVLDATCAADVTKCADFLNKAAQNLTTDANCKTEFQKNQTQVLQAWRGLRAYNVLYSATCLQDASSASYCFANAVTNLSTPSDTFLYYMPYGLSLPGASTPTCDWCTKNTMSIYHSASADRNQFVASTYEDAARQVNTLCGPNFVNSTLPAASNGASAVVPSYLGIAANTLLTLFLFALCS